MKNSVLDNTVMQLNDVFRTNKKELVETKGSIHEYLDLTIDFNTKNQVIFMMYDYIY